MSITTTEHETPISIESVLFEVQDGIPVEIAPSVLDIDIFEHIDKPYLTAVLSFVNFDASIDFLSIEGGERITISLSIVDEYSCRMPSENIFYIDKIIKSEKIKDDQEQYILHLIEDIAFLSKTKNINQCYSGNGSDIIKKISKDHLGRDVIGIGNLEQEFMKLIVPNMNPIESMHWVKNRLSTKEGFPLYLFSSLLENDLELVDLGHLLTQPIINWDIPYMFSESNISRQDPMGKVQRRTILSYESRNTSNMFSLLDKGMIGADYTYIDVTKNKRNRFIFDVESDVNDKFRSTKISKEVNVDPLQYEWMSTETPRTKNITEIGGTSSYRNWDSLSERKDVAAYKSKITSRSMANILTKDPILISVNGQDFFNGEDNTSIGRKIRVLFIKNAKIEKGEETDTDIVFDKKKSGDFLIFACKHSIRQESYTVSMSLVKVDVDTPEVSL